MAIQSFQLDPDAVFLTADEIVGKINSASANISRANSVEATARPIAEGEVGAIELEGESYTSVEKTKLGTVEDNAAADQTGPEIKNAYEAEANAYTDTLNTKLAGIEEGAKDDLTGPEVRDLVVALADTERKIVITDPETGEFKITAVQRTAAGELDVDYDDVATT